MAHLHLKELSLICDMWLNKITYLLTYLRGLFQIPRFFTNLENSLSYSIGKVRALKFTIYIILITHISGCVWFLDACYGKE